MTTLAQASPNVAERFLARLSAEQRAIVARESGGLPALPESLRPVDPVAVAPRLAPNDRPDLEPLEPLDPPPNRAERRAAGHLAQRLDRIEQNKYVARLQRETTQRNAFDARQRARLEARRGAEAEPPPWFPRELWREVNDIVHDTTGRAARRYLDLLTPVWRGMIRRAALGERDGLCARNWHSERARAIAALGYALIRLRKRVRGRKRWTGLVRGYPLALLAKLIEGTSRGREYHRNTLLGIHREGHVGYLNALRDAGLIYWQQLRPEQCSAFEVWRTSRGPHAANRYWVRSAALYDAKLSDDARARILELARIDCHKSNAEIPLRGRVAWVPEPTLWPAPAAPDS